MKRMNLIKTIVATGTVAALSVSMLSATVIAGSFVTTDKGIWYKNDDGTYPSSVWKWIDADGDGQYQCYAFDENGYVYVNTTTPDGFTTSADGSWIQDGVQVARTASEDLTDVALVKAAKGGGTASKQSTTTTKAGTTTTITDTTMKVGTITTGVDSSEVVVNKHTITRSASAGSGVTVSEPDMSQTSFDTNGPSVPESAVTSTAAPTTDTSTINVLGPDGQASTGNEADEDY